LITCLWQAFPEFSSHDILAAVRLSSDRFSNPDDRYGYGIPDFEKAYHALLIKRLARMNPFTVNDWIRVFPVPFYQNINVYFQPSVSGIASIQLLDVSGKIIETETFPITASQSQLLELNVSQPLATGIYFIRYADPRHSKTLKVLKY
jgi:serine protease AprX